MADWVELAERAIRGIAGRGRLPLVVGGTGLYLRALLRGVLPVSRRDAELRARLKGILERRGAGRMHRWLRRLDPDSALRVHPADRQRIVRALELALAGHGTWSDRIRADGTWSADRERYDTLKIGVDLDREAHARVLNRRVDRFFEQGLVAEVRRLLNDGVPRTANAFRAIGYREVLDAIEAGGDPESAREAVKRSTRRYAKRQRTWFRTEPDVCWLDASVDTGRLADRVVALWRNRARSGRP